MKKQEIAFMFQELLGHGQRICSVSQYLRSDFQPEIQFGTLGEVHLDKETDIVSFSCAHYVYTFNPQADGLSINDHYTLILRGMTGSGHYYRFSFTPVLDERGIGEKEWMAWNKWRHVVSREEFSNRFVYPHATF